MRWAPAFLAIFLSCTATPALEKAEFVVDAPPLLPTDLHLRERWLGQFMSAEEKMRGPSAIRASEMLLLAPQTLDDPRPKWRRTLAQGVMLARICVSEDSRGIRPLEHGGSAGELTADHVRILHTVLNNAGSRSFSGWGEVMAFLSPHVTGSRTLSKPRQQWTSTLPAAGDEAPAGWVPGRDGNWEIYREHWPDFRLAVQKAWVNLSIPAIEGRPIAWGNERDVARGMRVRGLVRVACDDCVNGFLERRARVVSAAAVLRGVR